MSVDPNEEDAVTAAIDRLDDLHVNRSDWTVDDLVSLPSDLWYELIDGRLILPSPVLFHQLLGVELVLALRPGCPEGYTPAPDMSLRVDRFSEPRPDVVVVAKSEFRRSPIPVDKALLVVEIISPDSRFRDMHSKTKIYAAAGLKHYWVIDPEFKHGLELTEFRIGSNGEYEQVKSTSGIFETDVPYPVKIDLPVLTALRDEDLARWEDR
jgi:Uma2 family endonuclease